MIHWLLIYGITALALGQSYDYPRVSKVDFKDVDCIDYTECKQTTTHHVYISWYVICISEGSLGFHHLFLMESRHTHQVQIDKLITNAYVNPYLLNSFEETQKEYIYIYTYILYVF